MNLTGKQPIPIAQEHASLLPSIHPSYARILCSYIKNKGYDVEALFIGCTLSWQSLLAQHQFISLEQFRCIAFNALKLTSKPWLGVEISRQLQVSVHGSLGYGAVAAPTVKDAFKLIERAMTTRISLLTFEYLETATGARFCVKERVSLTDLNQLIYPMLIGAFCDIIEKTTGSKALGVRVTLPFAMPDWFDKYTEYFPELDFRFGDAAFSLDIPQTLLETHSLTADSFDYRNATRECQQLIELRAQGGNLSEQVKSHLFSLAIPNAKQTEVSSVLGISVRTLIRKLKAENTNFQAILNEVRAELACWKLQNTELSIDAIAESVGFLDTSNFARVFKGWLGSTPSQFRKEVTSL